MLAASFLTEAANDELLLAYPNSMRLQTIKSLLSPTARTLLLLYGLLDISLESPRLKLPPQRPAAQCDDRQRDRDCPVDPGVLCDATVLAELPIEHVHGQERQRRGVRKGQTMRR